MQRPNTTSGATQVPLGLQRLSQRPLFVLTVAVLLGVAVGPGVPLWTSALVGLSMVVLASLRRSQPGALVALVLAASALGAFVAKQDTVVALPPTLVVGELVSLEGLVDSVTTSEHGTQVLLRVAAVDRHRARFRALMMSSGRIDVVSGQTVLMQGTLKPLSPALNEGQSNRSELFFREAVLFGGRFKAESLLRLTSPSKVTLFIARQRQRIDQAVERVALSRDSAALVMTLSSGRRAALGDAWEQAFSASGLAHVLSVSGLHVALLALSLFRAMVWLSTRRSSAFFRRVDPKSFASMCALPLVWLYVALTGNQTPAIRSAAMCSLVFAGHVFQRRSDGLNALSASLLLFLLWWPACVADLSLQLSFSAVLSLLLVTPRFESLLAPLCWSAAPPHRLAQWAQRAWSTALTTFSASVAVTLSGLPLVAHAFQRFSLMGLVSNVVMLPVCGLLSLLSALGAGLALIAAPLSWPLFWAASLTGELMLHAVRAFAHAPFSATEVPSPSWPEMALFWTGLAIWTLSPRRGWVGVSGMVAACGLTARLALNALKTPLTVSFLAVGQGDSILISSKGRHALIDGGGTPGGGDVGKTVVLPALRQRGISRLELSVLTHPHPDHALGLTSALQRVPTAHLWLAAGSERGGLTTALIDSAKGAVVHEVQAGAPPFQLGDATLAVLGPPIDSELIEGENDRSVVTLLRHGDVSFLLTGDIEAAGEDALPQLGNVTVLKAAHHGSRTSSGSTFLSKIRPSYVVFCVGRLNRFSFPHDEVLERFEALGAKCFRTDLDGEVRFESDGTSVNVTRFR
jgi:competence protein ComEC